MKATQEKMVDAGEEIVNRAADKVTATIGRGKERLGSVVRQVQDSAIERADEARESLSEAGERLAATLKRASMSDDTDAMKSRVFTSVADGLTSASAALKDRSVADLAGDLRGLARRHPGAFAAAAAVAGFAAARFLRASARRGERTS